MGCWVVLDHGEKREILEMHDKIDRYRTRFNAPERAQKPPLVGTIAAASNVLHAR